MFSLRCLSLTIVSYYTCLQKAGGTNLFLWPTPINAPRLPTYSRLVIGSKNCSTYAKHLFMEGRAADVNV